MTDPFQSSADAVSAPARRAIAVTPHDTNALTDIPKALYVGTAGNIAMRGVDGAADQAWKNVPARRDPAVPRAICPRHRHHRRRPAGAVLMNALGFGTGFRLNRRSKISPVFDFTGGVLPAGASLTRASAGTRCDVAGALASEASDVARFDYDPVGHGLKGLLIEAAATNVALNSQDWTQSSWTASNVTATAATLVETASTAIHRVQLTTANRALTSGVAVTMSAVAAELAGSAKRYLGMTLGTMGFAAQPSATFDLASGTVTQAANGSAGCVAAPGGWLCWLSAVPNANVSTGSERYFVSNASGTAGPSYAGDGASGLAVGEAQFETGSAPSSRIRSGASAGVRAGDALTLDWSAKGIPDGAITVRFSFDDGSTQDIAGVVSGGLASVPASLDRPWLRRAERV